MGVIKITVNQGKKHLAARVRDDFIKLRGLDTVCCKKILHRLLPLILLVVFEIPIPTVGIFFISGKLYYKITYYNKYNN